MTRFPDAVTEFWARPFTGAVIFRDDRLSLTTNPDLTPDERVTVLHTVADSHTAIAVRPEIAEALAPHGIHRGGLPLEEALVRNALVEIGIVLHGADNLYYFPDRQPFPADADSDGAVTRQLTASDTDLFADFSARTTESDRDDSQVDLDDWAAFGVILHDRLVSAASTYPWRESRLADIGVLTLASARGHGYGRRLVRAMAQHALEANQELQYRCQLDNDASNALARAVGLELFGRWEVPTP